MLWLTVPLDTVFIVSCIHICSVNAIAYQKILYSKHMLCNYLKMLNNFISCSSQFAKNRINFDRLSHVIQAGLWWNTRVFSLHTSILLPHVYGTFIKHFETKRVKQKMVILDPIIDILPDPARPWCFLSFFFSHRWKDKKFSLGLRMKWTSF